MERSGITIPIPQKRISCQALLNFDRIVHHGILRKRTVVNKLTDHVVKSIVNTPPQLMQWPRRYVVIHDGCIYMYKEETSNKATYAVSLYGYNSVLPCTTEVQGKLPWPFKVVHALNDKELSLYFSAPTERDMNIWVEHIMQQLIFANGFNAASGMVRSGATLTPQLSFGGTSGSISDWSSRASTSSGESGSSVDGSRSGTLASLWNQRATAVQSGEASELIYMTDEEDEEEFEDNGDYDQITEHGLTKPLGNLFISGTGSSPAGSQLSSTTAPARPGMPPKPPRHPPPIAAKPSVNNTSTTSYDNSSSGFQNEPNALVKPSFAQSHSDSNTDGSTGSAMGPVHYGEDKTPCLYSTQGDFADEPQYMSGGDYLDMEIPQAIQHPDKGIENAYWRRGADEADNAMKKIPVVGSYMVRASQESGHQTLLVKGDNVVRKYKIRYNGKDGKYSLTSNAPSFDSLAALIAYYKVNNLPQHSGPLTRPYSTVWKAQ